VSPSTSESDINIGTTMNINFVKDGSRTTTPNHHHIASSNPPTLSTQVCVSRIVYPEYRHNEL